VSLTNNHQTNWPFCMMFHTNRIPLSVTMTTMFLTFLPPESAILIPHILRLLTINNCTVNNFSFSNQNSYPFHQTTLPTLLLQLFLVSRVKKIRCKINDRQPIKNRQCICIFQESVQTALCIHTKHT
jgi:hypothetical protein